MNDRYHHGALRRSLLDAAIALITEEGVAAVSLRELARRVDVSHAAPAHHFGDRRGLLTALAAEGLDHLAAALAAGRPQGFDAMAVAYVRFARANAAHYAVMFRPELLDVDDPELVRAQAEAQQVLSSGAATVAASDRPHLDDHETARVAWALVHGLASLESEGVIPSESADALTLKAARQLFSPAPDSQRR